MLKDKKESKDEAFTADTTKKKSKKDIECHNCRKGRHVKADCWAKGGRKEGQGPRRNCGATAGAASQAEEQSLEAWAAIEEVECTEANPRTVAAAMAGSSPVRVEQVRGASELYDSGASRHMSPYRERFVSYQSIPLRAITTTDKRIFYAIGTRDLQIKVPNGTSTTSVLLRDALHAPDMGITIVSINRITKAGYTVSFEGDSCKIKNQRGATIGTIPVSSNSLYKVDHAYVAATALERVDLPTLHRQLGHITPDSIRVLIRSGAVDGIQLIDDKSALICNSCEYAKATRKAIHKEQESPLANAFGAEVHTDLWGPSPIPSLGGRKYYVTFTDDHTQYTRISVLRFKDQMLDAYKAFVAWAHTQHGARIKRLRSD